MGRTLDQVIAELPPERRERVEARYRRDSSASNSAGGKYEAGIFAYYLSAGKAMR